MKQIIAILLVAAATVSPAYAANEITAKKTKMVEAIDELRAQRAAYNKAHGYTADKMEPILRQMEERKKYDILHGVKEKELTLGDIDIPAPTKQEIDLANVRRSTSRQTSTVYAGTNLQDLTR